MSSKRVFDGKPKLLLCTSLFFHQKTSYIKIYKNYLDENFESTYFDIFSYFNLYGRSETENYIKKIINQFDIICITTDKPYYNFDFFVKLKKINNKIIIVYTDGDAVTNFPSYTINFINEIDLYPINDSIALVNFLKSKKKNAMLWTAVYNQDFYKIENSKKIHDLIFYGGKNSVREEYINHIKENKIQISLYGKGFNYYSSIKELNENINKSKIGLAINSNPKTNRFRNKFFSKFDNNKQIKGKNLEIPLSGTFLLAEYFDDLNYLYTNNKEAVFFETKQEMIELIRYYLKNDEKREEIALSGHLKAIQKLDGNIMACKLVEEINKIYNSRNESIKEKLALNYKLEKNYFLEFSLNYAFVFLSKKNFKAFFDMLKALKYGIPIIYLIIKIKQTLLNLLFNYRDILFKKKK